jgi:hypothetical protein
MSKLRLGFGQKMSTVDNVFVLNSLINHVLNQGKQLFALFVDFSKAFDYVVREKLWYKLIKLGLRGNILNIMSRAGNQNCVVFYKM